MASVGKITLRIDGERVVLKDPRPPLPRAQVRITDDMPDRSKTQIEVWVDGRAVAWLPLTSWAYEGGPSGVPQIRMTMVADGAAIDSRMP